MYRCVVITGASSGIGLEIANLLVHSCEHLVLVARRQQALEEFAQAQTTSCQIHTIPMDLEAPKAPFHLWEVIASLGLSPDVWVNNAGYGLHGHYLEIPLEREQSMVQLNVVALQSLTKLAARHMATHGGGRILNIASVAAFQPGPGMAVYFASKSFVLSLSEALDCELAPHGVRVLALCPGNTSTAFHQNAGTQRVKLMHRLAVMSPQAVAKMAVWQIQNSRPVYVTGWLNWCMVNVCRFLPRSWVVRISAAVLR